MYIVEILFLFSGKLNKHMNSNFVWVVKWWKCEITIIKVNKYVHFLSYVMIKYCCRDKVVMPTSLTQTIRGLDVAVTITMVLTRVRSTSTTTLVVVTLTTRGARCLSLVTTIIKNFLWFSFSNNVYGCYGNVYCRNLIPFQSIWINTWIVILCE